ncbi:MAG: septal ring lytic transglycosylase RlpA family protein [Alphaproteobacteria bacterium]|nr:septal ring lytic transglycosylase RlpA family protein [Alphaproteobacteria bacterium]
MFRLKFIIAATLLLAGCASFSDRRAAEEQGRRVAAGGIYKIGTPYEIEGDWYYPQEDTTYDNTGIASWYGSKFHGRRTANGEIFDMDLLTAAHPTLPMPVRAKVTNLENGHSVVVRINDRGPFAKDREIDMSRHAADVLGFKEKGTAQVRVQYLGRAPLYDSAGRLIKRQEPDRFIAEKPITPKEDSRVAAAPIEPVDVLTADGKKLAKPEPDIEEKRYAVQVGVFSMRQNAEALQEKLKAFSPVKIVEVKMGGATLYRVKMGGANIRADARSTLERLVAAGHADAVIIEQ